MRSSEKVVRRQCRKLANYVRRHGLSECEVALEPEGHTLAPPLPGGAPWIGRILPAPKHEILLSADGIRIDDPQSGVVEVEFEKVVHWDWLAPRTKNKKEDGCRLLVQLESGSQVILHAPGWSWQTVYHLFRLIEEVG